MGLMLRPRWSPPAWKLPVRRPAARPDVRPAPDPAAVLLLAAPHRPLHGVSRNTGTHHPCPTGSTVRPQAPLTCLATLVGRAPRLAAKNPRKTARMYGTPIYIVETGGVVAKKP